MLKTKENITKELNSQVLNRKEVGISGTSEDIQKCKEIFDEGVICKTKIRWSVDDSAPTGILSLIDIERFVPYRATYEFTLTKELEDIFLEYLDGMSLQKSRSILNNVMSRIDNYSVINLK